MNVDLDGFPENRPDITHWREADGKYLGYLNDYPDHWTQGET